MKKLIIKTFCIAITIFSVNALSAQSTTAVKATIAAWDGMAIAGYVNN
jgi:hypothetical protein